MRITKLSKVLALVGLGAGSFLVVYFAMNRPSPARSVRDIEGPFAETFELRDGSPWLPADVGKTYRTGASSSITKPLVAFDGDVMTVDASASVRDTRPNLGYVWAVHVFLSEDTGHELAVYENWFEDQPVEVTRDESVDLALFERLPTLLPPGDYRVIVGAYRVRPDIGLAGLKTIPASRLLKQLEGPSSGTLATRP